MRKNLTEIVFILDRSGSIRNALTMCLLVIIQMARRAIPAV